MTNMKITFRKTIYASTVLLAIILFSLGAGSCYMLSYSLGEDPNRKDVDSAYNVLYKRVPDMRCWVDSLKQNGLLRDTFITMPSGERHHAIYLRADSAQGRTAIVVHGYRDTAPKYLYLGRMYHRDLGFNILMPDLHAHGLSDGEGIGMGWNERHDVIRWAEVAEELFRCPSHESKIVIHGVSMGAATTMNLSGEPHPSYIKCFVADCGFTSVWDEFRGQLREQFSLPPFPLMHIASRLCRMKYGWTFREASPLKQVAKCQKPILFIHGEKDTYVPTEMVYRLYEAKPAPKQLWTVPNTGHADSYRNHPAVYTQRVKDFLSSSLN